MNLAILFGVKRANSCAAAILLAPFFFRRIGHLRCF